MTKDIKSEIVNAVTKIKPLPRVVFEIAEILKSPDSTLTDIEKCISKDGVITARLLSIANSSFYGFQGKIYTVKDACLLLGMNTISHLVTASAMMEQLSSFGDLNSNYPDLYEHPFLVATAACSISTIYGGDKDLAYTAGLLHDMGRIPIVLNYPELYSEVLSRIEANPGHILEAETAVFGINHCEIGEIIVKKWGLPEELCLAVRDHHDVNRAGEFVIANVINLSDKLVHAIKDGAMDVTSEARSMVEDGFCTQDQLDALMSDLVDTITVRNVLH